MPCHHSSTCFSLTQAYVRVVLSCRIWWTLRCSWPALCRWRARKLWGGMMGSRLVCSVPVWVSGVRYKKVLIRHAVMFILTCSYFFLYFFDVMPCSLSMLWFRFPTLTPAVWLNQSDRLWVPGERLSLSPQCLSPQVYALCDKLIVAPFENALLSVWRLSVVSSHSHTCMRTTTKCTDTATQRESEDANRYMQGHTRTQDYAKT